MAQPIHVERTSRPWFGPRARAREVLKEHRGRVAEPEQVLDQLVQLVGAESILGVRFIDFVHRQERFRYTIAVVWTVSDAGVRDTMYEGAVSIAQTTGWYVLVQGERIASVNRRRRAWREYGGGHAALPRVYGCITAISSAVAPEGGCAIRVTTERGSLLLDAGFPDAVEATAPDVGIVVTHSHRDHAGGVVAGTVPAVPTLTTLETAVTLTTIAQAIGQQPPALIAKDFGDAIPLGQVTAELFPVPHSPGACGVQLTAMNAALVFTGDICLRSAAHDYIGELEARLTAIAAPAKYVLLDATMAGRPHGASGPSPVEAVLERLDRTGDVVITAQSPDQLLYAYLDLFSTIRASARRETVAYVMTPRARPLFELVHEAFITRAHERMDPYLLAHYGKTMSAWAESRWLFWLGNRVAPPRDARCWLVLPSEIAGLPIKAGPVIHIGRQEGTVLPPGFVLDSDVDTRAWTLHSDDATLREAVARLSRVSRVVLFHNFPKRLRQWLARHGLDADVLSQEPLSVPRASRQTTAGGC